MNAKGTSDAPPDSGQGSYPQIFRSSSIMGGAAVITLLLGMVRTKFAAVLVGTVGTGLLANFVALQGMLTMVAGLGIGSSAVRDIARAHGRDDREEMGRAALTLRRACWLTGVAGTVLTLILSPWLSRLTFGSGEYTWHIAALSLTILLGNLQGGQTALLQGSRELGKLARLQLAAAAAGTAVSVLTYSYLGIDGLVPALMLMSLINYAVAWYFGRQVVVPRVHLTYLESFRNAGVMARLGVGIMWSALAGSAATYAINALITHQLNVQSLGIYSAAFALSGIFVNFVLGAMVSDYYPRLAAVSDDDRSLNRLVNEQTEVGLLLAIPGLVATMTLAPWAIHIFYTREFLPAAVLLQWFALGCLGRVIGWPLGFLLLAKSRVGWMVACETTIQLTHLVLVYLGVIYFGLAGAAIAFVVLYVLYTAMVFAVARHLTGFSWSRACAAQIALGMAVMAVAWMIAQVDSLKISTPLGLVWATAATAITVRGLTARLGTQHRFTRAIQRIPLLRRLAFSPPV